MTNLVNIQPGDLIAASNTARTWGKAPAIQHLLYRVTKRTPTQAEAVNVHNELFKIRVRVSDGKIIGEDYYRKAVVATPEIIAQHNAEVAARNRRIKAQRRLEDLDTRMAKLGLTVEQMEVLADAWERVKAMGKGGAA